MPSGQEPLFVSEFVVDRFAGRRVAFNVPLGAIPQSFVDAYGSVKAAAVAHPWRPRVDAVIWDGDSMVLLEGEIDSPRGGLSDLLFYRGLWRQTAEYAEYHALPLRLLLVVPWSPDWLSAYAEAESIELATYTPAWVADITRRVSDYQTAPYRQRRADRKRALQQLGLE